MNLESFSPLLCDSYYFSTQVIKNITLNFDNLITDSFAFVLVKNITYIPLKHSVAFCCPHIKFKPFSYISSFSRRWTKPKNPLYFTLPRTYTQLGHCSFYHILSTTRCSTLSCVCFAATKSLLPLYLSLNYSPCLECLLQVSYIMFWNISECTDWFHVFFY